MAESSAAGHGARRNAKNSTTKQLARLGTRALLWFVCSFSFLLSVRQSFFLMQTLALLLLPVLGLLGQKGSSTWETLLYRQQRWRHARVWRGSELPREEEETTVRGTLSGAGSFVLVHHWKITRDHQLFSDRVLAVVHVRPASRWLLVNVPL